jgi:serpin B
MRYLLGIVLFLPLLLAGAEPVLEEKPEPKVAITPSLLETAQGVNRFSLDLYGRLRDKQGNLFFSPYSISTALAMTYVGARNETAAQMSKTLHFTLEPKKLHPAFRNLMLLHKGGSKAGYQLNLANALWGQKDFGFLPDFLDATKTNYGAGLHEVDFKNRGEEARRTINAWVEKQTNNKIKDLLQREDIKPDVRLVLTNAIYFKSAWMVPFRKAATYKEPFHLRADRKIPVPMMHQVNYCGYLDGGTFQALSLPYKNDQLSMVVLLPKKVDGLGEFEKGLTAGKLKGLLEKMAGRDVNVTLPKFKITQRMQLATTLSAMGMPLPFDKEKADFSGISGSTDPLFIARVIHKAFVDVNEEGTEAAAATAVGIKKDAAGEKPPQPPVFRADHPFLFLIRDNRSGTILFMGRVVEPRS